MSPELRDEIRLELSQLNTLLGTFRPLLRSYLGFRHVFRHSYTYQLRWEKMQPLIASIDDTLRQFELSVVAIDAD